MFWMLDVLQPRGTTWSSQVISSPRGLDGGPSCDSSCMVAASPELTGFGALSLPGFPISPLPGQCVT